MGSVRPGTQTRVVVGAAVAISLVLSACGLTQAQGTATVSDAVPTTVVPGDTAPSVAAATAATLFEDAPVVVAAGADDVPAQARAASVAVSLGTPMLLTGPGAELELDRLETDTVLAVGAGAQDWAADLSGVTAVAAPEDPEALAAVVGRETPYTTTQVTEQRLVRAIADLLPGGSELLTLAPAPESQPGSEPASDAQLSEAQLPETDLPEPLDDVVVLASQASGIAAAAAAATSRAAGAEVQVMRGHDPRGDAGAIATLESSDPAAVLGLGDGFGSDENFAYRTEVAATGAELPGGGKLVLPGRLMVALYGHPGIPALGVMGEQDVAEAVERAKKFAERYEPHTSLPVVPTFEIITTVAARDAGQDGNYSNETDPSVIRPWVEAAGDAGMYVVLDLQSGRANFLEQAKRYEGLLRQPHVGLALDPEWRIGPNELPLSRIGSVTAAEINSVIEWLAALVVDNDLPQKMLLLHQFRLSMIENRSDVRTDVDPVAVLLHADGFGTPKEKLETYDYLTRDAPPGFFWGWKNFIDEDQPTFTPKETMTLVSPTPSFVSYQ